MNDYLASMSFFLLLLSFFVSYYTTVRTASCLHAPLMSLTNGVSGVILIFALDRMMNRTCLPFGPLEVFLLLLVLFILSLNIVGGVLMTQRMVSFFQPKSP